MNSSKTTKKPAKKDPPKEVAMRSMATKVAMPRPNVHTDTDVNETIGVAMRRPNVQTDNAENESKSQDTVNRGRRQKLPFSPEAAMRNANATKPVHSDIPPDTTPSTPARVVKEEQETPASARGVLVCSLSAAEKRILHSKNFLFDDTDSLEDKQRLRVACMHDAKSLFGQSSSEPTQLLMIAATSNRIPGLRFWYFEPQVFKTYIRKLIKDRGDFVEEQAFAVQHKSGVKYDAPLTEYLYKDIGELTASIEPAVVDLTFVTNCVGECHYAQSPGDSCYEQSL
jgi:hypothetical protein